ncbi:hypothetical protein H2198_001155 [Neophaeococcomyces mojaviensis]|uniref:Uncharacterized protein n=1 Tax=Neophaeococcomyces mojaviensis TaxID=3383035 RepID=A0ACC3AII2_9EURO|nr:hypothetical protein H2198_001155 [Knufia sp. JES_112]
MSSRKGPLAELSQPHATPSRRGPSTPHGLNTVQQRTGARLRSARSVRHVDANSVRPGSARGILRRLAKISAPTTKRRIVTPTSAHDAEENHAPLQHDESDDEDMKQPKLNFQIEESIEEEDSEIPVAPTPSAFLEDTDDDDEPPTVTFQNFDDGHDVAQRRKSRVSFLPQSDSAIADENAEDGDDGNSTFMTERGRRAVSEEATKMSRYSFGSIRMSEFGSELEIRRQSDRQQKLAALQVEDYGGGIDIDIDDNDVILGGETEDLRNVRRPASPIADDEDGDSFHIPDTNSDTFQLDIPDFIPDHVMAPQQAEGRNKLLPADSILVEDEPNELDNPATPQATSSGRRQTLLESVAATARPQARRKLKMNQRGNMVPSLASSLIKRIVHDSQEKGKKRKTTLGKEHMKALEQATEWFFEQVGQDLEAYSSHGKRKKRIDADDVLLLMRRQRVLRHDGELRQLAKDWLPREMLNELHLPDRP